MSSLRDNYLVARRNAGFGDCLWSLASAWQYAQLTGRVLVVDWRSSSYLEDKSLNAFPLFFEPVDKIDGVTVIADDRINELDLPGPFYPECWDSGQIRSLVLRPNDALVENRKLMSYLMFQRADIPASTLVFDACLIGACAQKSERILFDAIRPKEEIQRRIDIAFEEHFAGHHVIGVHVRHGNGENIDVMAPYWSDLEPAVQRILEAIDQARSLHDGPCKIFVCTDSPAVMERLINQCPDSFALPKEYPALNAGRLHSPSLGMEGAIAALVDMYLLARCDTVVRYPPASSFSRYAQLFAPRVIDVEIDGFNYLFQFKGSSNGPLPSLRNITRLAQQV